MLKWLILVEHCLLPQTESRGVCTYKTIGHELCYKTMTVQSHNRFHYV